MPHFVQFSGLALVLVVAHLQFASWNDCTWCEITSKTEYQMQSRGKESLEYGQNKSRVYITAQKQLCVTLSIF